MFKRILPDVLLAIVNEYAEPMLLFSNNTIQIIIAQEMLNCWADRKFCYFSALCDACKNNDLSLVKWLCRTVVPKNQEKNKKITYFTEYVNKQDYGHIFAHPLRLACIVGNLKIVKWLIKFFGYKRNDIRYMDNYCLLASYYNKNIELSIWLIKQYDIRNLRDLNLQNVNNYYDYTIEATIYGSTPYNMDNSGRYVSRGCNYTLKLFLVGRLNLFIKKYKNVHQLK